jgi:Nnf1
MFSADELYTGHLTPFLEEASNELRMRLQTTQRRNQEMIQTIESQRAEIQMLMAGLEGVAEDIEQSVAALESGDLQGLRNDTYQMEMEVAATR